ncbi:MAG: bifunctional DNA-formamidopyrimidine glycosylase/DNA-(apurinic or apyrimidinic site) lyase [Magnetococcales bacterium]|nr:bifunctional DNA-formamidopyrimidine glycosylase/DNA-(apurinic or apyrimidinic site) lyase [Magnetococcales bacterium]
MPELPEVETIRAGLAPRLTGRVIRSLRIHTPTLRWPIPIQRLELSILGQTIRSVTRRGKYLLWACGTGHVLIHLGMSGRLFTPDPLAPRERHDHVIWTLDDGTLVCLNDPRRFGAVLWIEGDWERHPLLAGLGPEPLEGDFHADHLFDRSRNRRVALQSWLMNAHMVVGVGNIYAAESLFLAGLHPALPAGTLTRSQCAKLVEVVQRVLRAAIEQGGTTLRDYRQSDGRPGYFAVALRVYGRDGAPCPSCGTPIRRMRLGQRSAFYCPCCQPGPVVDDQG